LGFDFLEQQQQRQQQLFSTDSMVLGRECLVIPKAGEEESGESGKEEQQPQQPVESVRQEQQL